MKKFSMDDLMRKRYTGSQTASVTALRRRIASTQRKKDALVARRAELDLERQRFMDNLDQQLDALDDWERRYDKELLDLFEQLEQYDRRTK